MSNNYLSLEIGGVKRGLKFNVNTMDKVKDMGVENPMAFAPVSSEYNDIKAYAKTVMHAALLSNLISKKEQPDFTETQVDEWLGEMSASDLYIITSYYVQLITPNIQVGGEAGGNTQGQALNVATG